MSLLCRTICGMVVALAAPAVAMSQDNGTFTRVHVPSETIQVRNRLHAIDRLLEPIVSARAAGSWLGRLALAPGPSEMPLTLGPLIGDRSEAVWEQAEEAYYRLMSDSGSALVSVPDSTGLRSARTSLQVRRVCQLRLASLPSALRAIYLGHVSAEANRLLFQGRKNYDVAPLRQLVEELVGSAAAYEALETLGDVAFERGDFDEARAWWRRLAPLPPFDPGAGDALPVSFPISPRVDRSRVEAKQILALAFEGRLGEAGAELVRFHHRHPTARGTLAGRDGLLSEILQATLQGVVKAGIANNHDAWPTYAGTPSRNQLLTVCPPAQLWEDGPAWRVALPALEPPHRGKGPQGERVNPARGIAFHPIIVAERGAPAQVLIADATSVTSFELTTGKRLFRHEHPGAELSSVAAERVLQQPRFTLSAEAGRVYARLGRLRLADAHANERSYLVCLDVRESAEAGRSRLQWQAQANANECFEGAPLSIGGRAYVALSRRNLKRVVTAIQCYDPMGRLRWSRDVCEVPEFEEYIDARTCQNLVTWAGNQLVYCTHTGAIVALDPWTGKTLWVVRYASRGPLSSDGEPSPRELAPCVYDNGRIFAAPLDSDRLFCLEAHTGRVLWECDGVEIVQLHGSTQGRVVFTTRHGAQAVSAANGVTLWRQPSEGTLAGLGRGLIAGSWLLWPTQDVKLPLRGITLAEGRQQKGDEDHPFAEPSYFDPTQLRRIPAGNLAFGKDCLVVAGADELVAFVPRGRLPLVPAEPERRPLLQASRHAAGRVFEPRGLP
jgi:outer membrane protein assembly factor BamB